MHHIHNICLNALRLLAISGMLLCKISFAGIIDFDDVDLTFGDRTGFNVTSYTEDGYTLSSSGDPSVYHNDVFGPTAPGLNSNGTNFFGWCGFYCIGSPFSITITSTHLFSLLSLDFTNMDTGFASSPIQVTGTTFDGSILSTILTPTLDTWQTFGFSGFNNLMSVDIIAVFGAQDMAMDNIVLATSVAEPGIIFMFVFGLILIVAEQRSYLFKINKNGWTEITKKGLV